MGRKSLFDNALSGAEKMKRYRKRKREEGKDVEMKIKDKERKRAKRLQINDDSIKREAAKQKERDRWARRMKNKTPSCDEKAKGMLNCTLQRSKFKAKRNLPQDSQQRRKVATELFFEELELTPQKKKRLSQTLNKTTSGRKPILSETQVSELKDFLKAPDISLTLPGRNNQMYVGKKDGKSIFVAKHFLFYTLRELHGIIKQCSNPHLTCIKLSTLHRFLQNDPHSQFKYVSELKQQGCKCPQCENLELMVEAINGILPENKKFPIKCHDMIKVIACEPLTKACTSGKGKCQKCPPIDIDVPNSNELVAVKQWMKDENTGYFAKVTVEWSVHDLCRTLKENLEKLKLHYYIKRVQSASYNYETKNLDDDTVLIHVDYAEKYKNKQQDEIKPAYYGTSQFTLYTAEIYYVKNEKVEGHSFTLVTDSEKQELAEESYSFNLKLLELAAELASFKKVIFWSDGCGSQYRSRYAFDLITHLPKELEITWNFFEHDHGKGCVDGIGGTVKNTVFRRVCAKKVVILNAKHFAEYANSILKTTVLYVSRSDMPLDQAGLCRDTNSDRSPKIPGTMRVHHIVRTSVENCFKLDFYETSNEVDKIKSQVYLVRTSTTSAPVANIQGIPALRNLDDVVNYVVGQDIRLSLLTPTSIGKFYCVFYDDKFYWGRLMGCLIQDNLQNAVKISFLKKKTNEFYDFPHEDSANYQKAEWIKLIKTDMLFFGPCSPAVTNKSGYNFGDDETNALNVYNRIKQLQKPLLKTS